MTSGDRTPWRWYHGVLFYALAQALTFGLYRAARAARGAREAGGDDEIERFYLEGYRPFFAPPSWAFGPAWTLNNVGSLWALLRALNMRPGICRTVFLTLQTLSWLDFVTFLAACFGLRSPLNGFVWTAAYFVLTLMSQFVALVRLRDRKLSLALTPLTLWLALATALSAAIARWNRDGFYGVGPFAEPDPRWVKTGS
ncbi:MAG: tryptophan-rich sensory protein [Chloroflexi bacterium]|nr:tryptophan-rich sensory protein [Chloroflexota bacterium]